MPEYKRKILNSKIYKTLYMWFYLDFLLCSINLLFILVWVVFSHHLILHIFFSCLILIFVFWRNGNMNFSSSKKSHRVLDLNCITLLEQFKIHTFIILSVFVQDHHMTLLIDIFLYFSVKTFLINFLQML